MSQNRKTERWRGTGKCVCVCVWGGGGGEGEIYGCACLPLFFFYFLERHAVSALSGDCLSRKKKKSSKVSHLP